MEFNPTLATLNPVTVLAPRAGRVGSKSCQPEMIAWSKKVLLLLARCSSHICVRHTLSFVRIQYGPWPLGGGRWATHLAWHWLFRMEKVPPYRPKPVISTQFTTVHGSLGRYLGRYLGSHLGSKSQPSPILLEPLRTGSSTGPVCHYHIVGRWTRIFKPFD